MIIIRETREQANKIPIGFCQCGCGQKTRISTDNRHGNIKGEPRKFLHGHGVKGGPNHPSWKGGKKDACNGRYKVINLPDHPRANERYVLEHIVIVENVMGKPLPLKYKVHHVNGNGRYNLNTNLVVCEDHDYHHLLHIRKRAFDACGKPNYRKCYICKEWDDPSNLIITHHAFHPKCFNKYQTTRCRSKMVIIRDTRENLGYDFACITPPPVVEVATLSTGDYSLKGLESRITIERKNLSDAFGTFGRGRARWERELERMAGYQFAAVVIEGDWHTIVRRPPARSRLNPKTVVASIAAWSQRFRVHFFTCPDREFAERFTYRLLERFRRDQNGKGP